MLEEGKFVVAVKSFLCSKPPRTEVHPLGHAGVKMEESRDGTAMIGLAGYTSRSVSGALVGAFRCTPLVGISSALQAGGNPV